MMHAQNRIASLGQLLLLAVWALATIVGCGGGGGGTGATLQFADEWGAPLSSVAGFTGQLSGGALPAAITLQPSGNGAVGLGVAPGTYRVQATISRPAENLTLAIDRSITVSGTAGQVIVAKLANQGLATGWTLYRAGDLAGAETEFTARKNAGVSGADDALGWVAARQGDFNDSVAAFDRALVAQPGFSDALVGHAGILLVRNSVTDPTEAEALLTEAITISGNYSSSPSHDEIRETDLVVARALSHFLQGDTVAAQADLDSVRDRVATSANFAGIDLFSALDLLIRS